MSLLYERCRYFYLKFAADLIAYARRFVDDFSAEDIVHDAFMRVYNNRMLSYTDEQMRKLLFVAVRNLCINYLHHQSLVDDYTTKRVAEINLGDLMDASPDDDAERQRLLDSVAKVVEQLPDSRRRIFKMYYYKGMDTKKIAEELNLSRRTVENNVYRAMLFVRNKMKSNFKKDI